MPREQYADVQLAANPPTKQPPYLDSITLLRGYLGSGAEAFCAKVTGTGASLDVTTPFDPAVVMVFNETDLSMHIKLPSMAGDDHWEHKAGTIAYITSNGITLGTKKFTLGTSANLNANLDVLHCLAFGVRDGVNSSL